MFGLGPVELFLASFFTILPTALVVAFVVFFLKFMLQISRDISGISQSVRNIEEKLGRKE